MYLLSWVRKSPAPSALPTEEEDVRVRLGSEGGTERVILCTAPWSFYLSVKVRKHYYRLAVGPGIVGWVYVGRS